MQSPADLPEKQKPYTVSLPASLMMKLARHAAYLGRTLKDVVRDALERYAEAIPPEDRLEANDRHLG